jgi:hypothetical protein
MAKSIRLSQKHGVNPSLMTCFVCGEAKSIALLGQLKGDTEAPHQACYDKEPCDKCKEYMKQGIILISVRDGEENQNPYRTGGWAVIKDEAVKRIIQPPELVDNVLKKRMAFVPDSAWDMIGLPREEQKGDITHNG